MIPIFPRHECRGSYILLVREVSGQSNPKSVVQGSGGLPWFLEVYQDMRKNDQSNRKTVVEDSGGLPWSPASGQSRGQAGEWSIKLKIHGLRRWWSPVVCFGFPELIAEV